MHLLKRIQATIWSALTFFRREPTVPYIPVSMRWSPAELVEKINIKMKLERDVANRNTEAIQCLIPNWKEYLKDSDTLTIDYNFNCEYLGTVATALRHIQAICDDPDVVLDVSCESLAQGHILIYEVLKRLEQVIKTVEARRSA